MTPIQPHKADSGAARTSLGRSQKMKQYASTQRRQAYESIETGIKTKSRTQGCSTLLSSFERVEGKGGNMTSADVTEPGRQSAGGPALHHLTPPRPLCCSRPAPTSCPPKTRPPTAPWPPGRRRPGPAPGRRSHVRSGFDSDARGTVSAWWHSAAGREHRVARCLRPRSRTT